MHCGELENRNKAKRQSRAFVCREVQRKGCFVAVQRVGKRCFHAVRIQQHQRIAVQQCRVQRDFHLPRGLSQSSAVLKAHAQHALAVLQIADAQHQLAARKTLRRRLRFLDQGQSRTVADLAADGTEREIISLRVLEQQAADKRLTENFPCMPAAASPAVCAAGSIAVRRPFAVPVAVAGNNGVDIAGLAADAGMQDMPLLRAGGLNRVGFIGMSQRTNIPIGAVVAAGAGLVGAPALFRAGGAFTSS